MPNSDLEAQQFCAPLPHLDTWGRPFDPQLQLHGGLARPSPGFRFSDLEQLIDAESADGVLAAVCRIHSADAGLALAIDLHSDRVATLGGHGVGVAAAAELAPWFRRAGAAVGQIWARRPGAGYMAHLDCAEQLNDPDLAFSQREALRAILHRQGAGCALLSFWPCGLGRQVAVLLSRRRPAQCFERLEQDRLKGMVGAVVVALRLHHRIAALRGNARLAASLVNQIRTPLLALDLKGAVLHGNARAAGLRRETDGVELHDFRLLFRDARDKAALEAALQRVGAGAGGPQRAGPQIIPFNADGPPGSRLLLTPLDRGVHGRHAGICSLAVLSGGIDLSDFAQEVMAAMKSSLGLTEAEVRVALQVAGGRAPADVARAFGLSMPTVRTHLSRALHKLGVERQSDLARQISLLANFCG